MKTSTKDEKTVRFNETHKSKTKQWKKKKDGATGVRAPGYFFYRFSLKTIRQLLTVPFRPGSPWSLSRCWGRVCYQAVTQQEPKQTAHLFLIRHRVRIKPLRDHGNCTEQKKTSKVSPYKKKKKKKRKERKKKYCSCQQRCSKMPQCNGIAQENCTGK